MTKTHIAIYILDIIALLFLFGLLHGDNLLGNNRKRAFAYAIVFAVLVILSEIGTIFSVGDNTELRIISICCNLLGFALTPVIPILLIAIFDTKIIIKHKLLLLPTTINILAVVLSPFLGLVFYVDLNNHYERGSFFFVFVAVYIINILLLAVITWYTGQKYLYSIKYKISALAFFTIVGSCIQIIVPSIYSSWHCVTLSLFLLYILLSEFDSSFDSITKLHNRAAFEKASKQLTEKKAFSVVVLDINDFKEINDNHGHDYGDAVLKEVASIIRNSFDNNCSCFRIGGDEFCIIRRDANQGRLKRQLKLMTNALTEEREKDNFLPTVSYGYSIYQGIGPLDFGKIMKEADNLMYSYKRIESIK